MGAHTDSGTHARAPVKHNAHMQVPGGGMGLVFEMAACVHFNYVFLVSINTYTNQQEGSLGWTKSRGLS